MKTICSIFIGRELDFSIQLTPKKKQIVRNGESEYEPMLKRHTSKIGTQSIIFQPTVGLRIINRHSPAGLSAMIPGQLIYQLAGLLQSLSAEIRKQTEDIYYKDPDTGIPNLTMSAHQYNRRLSVYRNMVVFAPGLIRTKDDIIVPGISIYLDMDPLGSMSFDEVTGLVDVINRFDLSTFSLLAGITDRVISMDEKLDKIMRKLGVQ